MGANLKKGILASSVAISSQRTCGGAQYTFRLQHGGIPRYNTQPWVHRKMVPLGSNGYVYSNKRVIQLCSDCHYIVPEDSDGDCPTMRGGSEVVCPKKRARLPPPGRANAQTCSCSSPTQSAPAGRSTSSLRKTLPLLEGAPSALVDANPFPTDSTSGRVKALDRVRR